LESCTVPGPEALEVPPERVLGAAPALVVVGAALIGAGAEPGTHWE